MKTKVFMSWSGEQSQAIAYVLRDWFLHSLQFLEPFLSDDDIAKGARWGVKLAAELESTNIGLIVLTPDNLTRPWILFEAGAISKLRGGLTMTLLFGVEPGEVAGPLAQFQSTEFSKEDFMKLARSLNSCAGNFLDDSALQKSFALNWPSLELEIGKILNGPSGTPTPKRSEREIQLELLDLVRGIAAWVETNRSPKDIFIELAGERSLVFKSVLESAQITISGDAMEIGLAPSDAIMSRKFKDTGTAAALLAAAKEAFGRALAITVSVRGTQRTLQEE